MGKSENVVKRHLNAQHDKKNLLCLLIALVLVFLEFSAQVLYGLEGKLYTTFLCLTVSEVDGTIKLRT